MAPVPTTNRATDSAACTAPKVSGAAAAATLVATSAPVPTKAALTRPPPGSGPSSGSCRRALAAGSSSAMAASLPLGERGAQTSGQPVVGELLDGPLPSGRRHAARAARGRRAARRAPTATASTSSGRSTTSPVSPCTHGFGRAAAVAGDLRARRRRPPRGTRCRSPPARGRPTGCGTTWRTRRRSRRSAGRSSWLTRPTIRTGAPVDAMSRSRRPRSRPPPPMATREVGWRGGERGRRPDEHVHPLAGHEPAEAHDERPVGGQPEVLARGAPAPRRRADGSARCRRPGGTSTLGSGRPGGPLALRQRVATGGDHEPGASEHVAQQEVRAGQPARAR